MKQFRTVKRRANVGERILITNRDSEYDRYQNGDVLTVKGVGRDGVNYKTAISGFVLHEEYEVIIEEVNPKEENEMNIEKRFELAVENVREAVEELRLAALAKGYEDARRDLTAVTPTFQTPQQQRDVLTRDSIIEQAKRDVAELKSEKVNGKGNGIYYYVDDPSDSMPWECYVEFIVNNEKRTVVALMRGGWTHIVRAKGIAKCEPTDCFNSAIGKAISLRRALGLEVPSEYLNAPQPTEVRVGDVVEIHRYDKSVCGNYSVVSIESDGWLNLDDGSSSPFRVQDGDRIIDDSREGE